MSTHVNGKERMELSTFSLRPMFIMTSRLFNFIDLWKIVVFKYGNYYFIKDFKNIQIVTVLNLYKIVLLFLLYMFFLILRGDNTSYRPDNYTLRYATVSTQYICSNITKSISCATTIFLNHILFFHIT